MDEIREHFQEAVNIIQEEIQFAQKIFKGGETRIAENMWRAQIVYLSAAFDYFMHEMTKYGVNNIFLDKWEKTKKYSHMEVRMDLIETVLKEPEKEWIMEFANEKFSGSTMVSYEDVKNYLNLIGINIKDVSNKAFYKRGAKVKPWEKNKKRLNELYARRNRIAHQNDRNHENAELKEINQKTVQDFCSDITKLVEAIYECAKEKQDI